MTTQNESTTLVCLFHHEDQAKAALEDLYQAGLPQSAVSVIGSGAYQASGGATLQTLGVPARDLDHLQEGIQQGGSIIAVSTTSQYVEAVERIFGEHHATKIDEASTGRAYAAAAPLAAGALATGAVANSDPADGESIAIVEEEFRIGKRQLDQGGIRVNQRTVEVPVEKSINLREEHVVVERNAVNRPATQADLMAHQGSTIELTETAEEPVVSKTARVVEEVVVNKVTGQRTEHIQDTVRHTELEVEDIPAGETRETSNRTF